MLVIGFFDWYMLLSVVLVILFLVIFVLKLQVWFKGVVFFIFVFFSMLVIYDYFVWNCVWVQVFEWLLCNDICMQWVDVGYEYNGWYYYYLECKGQFGKFWWWVDDDEWMIVFGLRLGYVMQAGFIY